MNYLKSCCIVFILRILSCLPLWLVQKIGHKVGTMLYKRQNNMALITSKNIAFCLPELSRLEQQDLTRCSVQETMKLVMEGGMHWFWSMPRLLKTIQQVDGYEYLEGAVTKSNGVIVILPHMGNWEVMGAYLGYKFAPLFMYKPVKLSYLDKVILKSRRRSGMQVTPTTGTGIMKVRRVLGQAGMVCILSDQEPDLKSGEFAPFFKRSALSIKLIARLTQKTGATVIAGYSHRLPDGKGFNIFFRSVDDKIYQQDIKQGVTVMNSIIEKCARTALPQYQWEYKRFKTRPQGSERLY